MSGATGSDDEIPPEVRALLDRERARPEPDAEVVAAIRAATEARLSNGGHGGESNHGGSAARAPRRVALSPRSALIGAVFGAIVGGAATRALWPVRERVLVERIVERSAPIEVLVRGADAGAIAPADADVPSDVERVLPAARARDDEGAAMGRQAAERALIERCSAALVRGDFAGAIAAAREHGRRFRDGALVEEREALTIQALRGLQRGAEADARAEVFLRRWPASMHRAAVAGAAP